MKDCIGELIPIHSVNELDATEMSSRLELFCESEFHLILHTMTIPSCFTHSLSRSFHTVKSHRFMRFATCSLGFCTLALCAYNSLASLHSVVPLEQIHAEEPPHAHAPIPLQALPQFFTLEKLLHKSKNNHHHCFVLRHKETGQYAILNLWYNSEDLAPEDAPNALWEAWEASQSAQDVSSPSISTPLTIHNENPSNDKYRRFTSHWLTNQKLDFELIYPATQWDIQKATPRKDYILQETPLIYSQFTYPEIIQRIEPRREQWIFNILNGIAEQEDILAQNEEFLLLPTPRFRSGKKEDFQGLVFFRNDSDRLRSIRDLRGAEDAELLERCKVFVEETLREKYQLPPSRYRMFFHYYPSFWRIHLHVTPVVSPVGHSTVICDRARNLQEIIEELRRDGEYCERATFQVLVNEPGMVEKLIAGGLLEEEV